ncbi:MULTISPECIES: response regulator transcription factor [Desulfococcus]|jgi:two-component system alkaline phosphatase synthesis response regulator PhoP|uniref:Response regulator receiver protein n=1 Tax=Desulfococcus multivorans DSM 2059 TaxID=1121405 RepID=S7TGC7_DESML|nr:response regulator [Desulfococcus multivorans]AOY59800.1 two component system response regulator [Desulfococcus multivorans]AQV01968.1 response regulator [Desulfococcus multivorans]EPR35801.1 response regulator receiver protein [Desulfococcus multivorans DSM 2059]MDX9817729.1 response regulator [Desulfococcus multivorans]SJZ33409.1 two-component system, OmpR family, alkaline phosphatase synthesis response regulator PhoP [Desulfococcus multivorans DSM 2059]
MSQKVVLVVDDEPDVISIVGGRLKKAGFAVEAAYNGNEALEKVRAKRPDCIVLDVMMPEKDGYEVCAELKKDPNLSDIPIVMLTAVADHVTSTRYSHFDGISMEADDYIPKGPDSTEQIVQSVKDLLA